MRELTHLSLFSGIGGLDLAAEWAGFRTVGQCEWADYPRAVLEKHWPGLPRWRDIRTLTGDDFYEKTGLRTVTVLSGGFPCQPFSTAGKRRGKEDDRYLWPEMLRVIQEIRPRWVVGENVAGIVTLALDTVLSDLESIGYACQAVIIPACAVDAPHRRDRCAILAHANNPQTPRQREHGGEISPEPKTEGPILCGGHVADTEVQRQQRDWACGERFTNARCEEGQFAGCCSGGLRNTTSQGWQQEPYRPVGKFCKADTDSDDRGGDVRQECELSVAEGNGGSRGDFRGGTPEHGCWEWWPDEPNVGRVAHGISDRVDRLKCLGNAVVPQQFYPVFRGIAELEELYGH